jgi:hypothetical protein
MFVCVHLFCSFVILCVGSTLATGSSPVQGVKESYRLCADYETEKATRVHKDCRTIDR